MRRPGQEHPAPTWATTAPLAGPGPNLPQPSSAVGYQPSWRDHHCDFRHGLGGKSLNLVPGANPHCNLAATRNDQDQAAPRLGCPGLARSSRGRTSGDPSGTAARPVVLWQGNCQRGERGAGLLGSPALRPGATQVPALLLALLPVWLTAGLSAAQWAPRPAENLPCQATLTRAHVRRWQWRAGRCSPGSGSLKHRGWRAGRCSPDSGSLKHRRQKTPALRRFRRARRKTLLQAFPSRWRTCLARARLAVL
jgi:hypothetical protein